jgi:hypothetical protein
MKQDKNARVSFAPGTVFSVLSLESESSTSALLLATVDGASSVVGRRDVPPGKNSAWLSFSWAESRRYRLAQALELAPSGFSCEFTENGVSGVLAVQKAVA